MNIAREFHRLNRTPQTKTPGMYIGLPYVVDDDFYQLNCITFLYSAAKKLSDIS